MGKYKRKTNRTLKFTQELLDEARVRIDQGQSKRSVANALGVNECSLRKRLKLGTTPVTLGRFKPVFTSDQEKELADHIRDLDNRFYGLRMKDLKSLAFQYAELNQISHRFNQETKMAGKHWIKDFARRNQLSLRAPEKVSLARATGFNKIQCNRFFDNLRQCYEKTKAPAHRIFNMDETGMSTVPNRMPKVFAPRGKRTVSKVVAAERGQLVTAVCCMGASGVWVPPALIFPRKRMKDELFYGSPPGTLQLVTESGYMNSELFIRWLRHFQDYVKSSEDDPVLLILDNHSSHCTLEAINFCRNNFIVLLSLPPHASHKMQPLDRCFFGPMKSAFSSECDKWMVQNPGRPVTLKQMSSLFHAAYSKVATIQICEKAFATTGLYPYNPDVFTEEDFAPSEVTDQQLHIELANDTPHEIEDSVEMLPGSENVEATDSIKKCSLPTSMEDHNDDEDNLPLSVLIDRLHKEPVTQTKIHDAGLKTPIKKAFTDSTGLNNTKPDHESIQDCQDIENVKSKLFSSPECDLAVPGTSGVTPKMIIPLPKAKHEQIRTGRSKRFLWIWMTVNLGKAPSAAERIVSVCPPTRPFQSQKDCICDAMDEKARKCRCSGPDLVDVPQNLTKNLHILVIEDAECLEVLKGDSLISYSTTLRELTLVNLESFYYFESGVFQHLRMLQTIYIQRAPKLSKIQPDVFKAHLPNLKILRIVNTALEEMPNLNGLNTTSVLHMIVQKTSNAPADFEEDKEGLSQPGCSTCSFTSIGDLEHNRIQKIQSKQVSNVRAEQLLLNFNDIKVVEEAAFAGSEIANLSLKGNFDLRHIHKRAFHGLQSLRYIDLSNTAITTLPTEGLREIDTLKLQHTKSLKVFPSIFNFQFLKEAWLTYPYHCCAFKFPRTHNPWEYEKHARIVHQLQETCKGNNDSINNLLKSQKDPMFKNFLHWIPVNANLAAEIQNEEYWGDTNEVFHNTSSNSFPVTTALCGEIYRNYEEIKCHPAPDAFNPCEDLMGHWALRFPVWIISLSAVIGNLFVVIVISTSHFRLTVSKFLMCNLAIADLCIGIHLILIAVVDACSIGAYFNSAIDWQEGHGCSVAGFLTIFGNILSVYTLAVITTERWYTITWAIHLNRRLKLRTAVRVMIAGWICALFMAVLPLIGISNYSKTSICLPLENKGKADAIYLSTLLAFNATAFALICVCYGSMYKSIREGSHTGSTTSVRSDLTVAKRMALLVFTDFACWAPIAFFGLTALLGYPLINVTQTKILLVFFYPLNSCANPCLYALLTQQYRRDFFILMGRYGLCKDRAERHKGAIGGKPLPYGAGPQYKRTCSEGVNKVNNHRASTMTSMTTIVSLDCPMLRTNSRNSTRHRPEQIMSMSEYPMKHNMNNFIECNRHISTDNL